MKLKSVLRFSSSLRLRVLGLLALGFCALLVALAYFSMDGVESTCPGNLILNGDFESGTANWTVGSGVVSTTSVAEVYSGTNSIKLKTADRSAEQGFLLTAGESYTATCFLANLSPAGSAQIMVEYYNSSSVKIGEETTTIPNSTPAYAQYTVTGTAPAGTTSGIFRIYRGAGTTANLLADEACVAVESGGPVTPSLSFTESAASWGLNIGGGKDGGFSWGDYDLDGDLDLLVNLTTGGSKLLRNNGSTFTEVTSTLAPDLLLNSRERSAIWADFNHDGYPDFARNSGVSGARRIEIYLQDPATHVFGNGSGGTTPIRVGDSGTNETTISNGLNSEAMGAFDLEGDGDLDLFFDNHDFGIDILRNNYVNHSTGAVANPSVSGFFTHATPGTGTVLGLAQTSTDGDYGGCADINDDGWVDIATRKKDEADLYFNQGGTFGNAFEVAQADNTNKGAIAFYDLDNDGDFDMIWTDNDGNRLFRRDPSAWTEITGALAGIPSTGIDGVAGGDLDNDGDLDLFFSGNSRSYLYINELNQGSAVGAGSPFQFSLFANAFNSGANGEGVTMVDLDQDGDLDIYLNVDGTNQLWINNLYSPGTLADNKRALFVEVWDDRSEYMQTGKQRLALGATVVLLDCQNDVISGIREVNGGMGHGTQDPSPIHFGLPHGIDYHYQVLVKYPYYNQSGTLVRKEIRKWVNPSIFSGQAKLVIQTSTATDDHPTVSISPDPGGSDLVVDISGPIPGSLFSFAWTGPNGFTSTSDRITPTGNGLYQVTCSYGGSCILTDQFTMTSFPVEWLSFGASWEGQNGLLQWATASETNSSYFGVERSEDGRIFTEIGQVQAKGTTSQVSSYQYLDRNAGAAARRYYRLRQVDLNGTFSYSNMVELMAGDTSTSLSFQVYPNPAEDQFTIKLETAGIHPVAMINVLSANGQAVYSGSVAGQEMVIQSLAWPEGVYLVQIISGNKSAVQRLVVRRK